MSSGAHEFSFGLKLILPCVNPWCIWWHKFQVDQRFLGVGWSWSFASFACMAMSFCLPTLNLPEVSTHYILISVLGFSLVFFMTYFLFPLFNSFARLSLCVLVCKWPHMSFCTQFHWHMDVGWIQEVLKRSINDDGVSPWERGGGKGVFICWEVSHGDTTTFHSPAQSAQRPHHPHPVCKIIMPLLHASTKNENLHCRSSENRV